MAIHKSSNWIGKNAPHFKDCVFFGPKKILIFNSMTSFVLTRLISIWRFYQYYTLRSGLHFSPYFSIRLPQGDAVQVFHSPCFLKYPLGRPYFGIGSWNPLDLFILGPMRNLTHTHYIYMCTFIWLGEWVLKLRTFDGSIKALLYIPFYNIPMKFQKYQWTAGRLDRCASLGEGLDVAGYQTWLAGMSPRNYIWTGWLVKN
jgi:hypothetical protein